MVGTQSKSLKTEQQRPYTLLQVPMLPVETESQSPTTIEPSFHKPPTWTRVNTIDPTCLVAPLSMMSTSASLTVVASLPSTWLVLQARTETVITGTPMVITTVMPTKLVETIVQSMTLWRQTCSFLKLLFTLAMHQTEKAFTTSVTAGAHASKTQRTKSGTTTMVLAVSTRLTLRSLSTSKLISTRVEITSAHSS